jgi:N-acetylglutamate synthase
MSSDIDIRKIEELSMNAFPSLQTQLLDGWVLRFSNGYAKRANSINPLYHSQEDINRKIEKCEKLYQRKGLKVIYKLTTHVFPEELDNILERKGYGLVGETSVQLLSLDEEEAIFSNKASIDNQLSDKWFSEFCELNHIKVADQHTLKQMLNHINADVCYVRLTNEKEETLACGMGVLEGGWIGLYDIVTSEMHRNNGYGIELVSSILNWGKKHGAERAYLQVMLHNTPALKLYEKLGFKEAYQYWYRIKKEC